LFLILANVEKRNLAKAQNAQRKEEIQKRLEKVQTQLGTKTKPASANSMTKRGLLFQIEIQENSLLFTKIDSSNFNSSTGAVTSLTTAPSNHPLSSSSTAAPISSKRLSESSASESDSDTSRNGDDTDSESG
jgi:hypothetical protein